MLKTRMPNATAAIASILLGAGALLIAGCNNTNDEDSTSDRPAMSTSEASRNKTPVKAGYEEKKKAEDQRISSDRRFHQRYDRNYDDQFEAAH